jgi:hypothetical protein
MPARTPCIKCGVVGFVRTEHVISGGRAVTDYYCGHCQHSWTTDQRGPKGTHSSTPSVKNEKPPDRSRS